MWNPLPTFLNWDAQGASHFHHMYISSSSSFSRPFATTHTHTAGDNDPGGHLDGVLTTAKLMAGNTGPDPERYGGRRNHECVIESHHTVLFGQWSNQGRNWCGDGPPLSGKISPVMKFLIGVRYRELHGEWQVEALCGKLEAIWLWCALSGW